MWHRPETLFFRSSLSLMPTFSLLGSLVTLLHLDLICLSFLNPSHTPSISLPQFSSWVSPVPLLTLYSPHSSWTDLNEKIRLQQSCLTKAFSDFLVYILRIKSKAFEIHCLPWPWPCLLRLPAYSIQAAWVFRFLKYAEALRGLGGFVLTLLEIVSYQIFAWLILIH